MIRECPDSLRPDVDRLVQAFGLEGMTLCVRETDRPGDSGALGLCSSDARYMQATISFKRDMTTDDRKDTLVHEFLHAALMEIDQAVEDRIVELLPEDQQGHAKALYNDALERTIIRLARGLHPILLASQPAEPEPRVYWIGGKK